ncbi:hypothetical protein [Methyloversatilis sp.]|uniref:hypothetical protein n=1 Tax=Methyloversatilis sp. TaxID=2569862 RepID=UPI00273394E3|nr:hypothetical protein [Methyloversatilis sp.]MDP2867354.1 hypothetical protein [Methyloversatilis sp.]MDP3288940.1 hypothetical protein [Methyloversatilis sp.]MDP3454654.1 hypothetical protein [Methyloversatilis sp.]MDP3579096.1 hypothetical protein [Methyloversatilis sp.]
MTLARTALAIAVAAFSVSLSAQPTYPSKHQKEVMPEAQQSESQKKYQPEQDQARKSTQYPSEHANEVVRDRDTKQKASDRADERERRPEGQTTPEPRN